MTTTEIRERVCRMRGVDPKLLKEKCRTADRVLSRQLIMTISYLKLNQSLRHIGEQFFTSSPHCQVIWARRRIRNLYETDLDFRDTMKPFMYEFAISEDDILSIR